jgi:hypothetical protein
MYKNNVYGLGRVISILLLFYCLAYPLYHVRHTERERGENWLKKIPKEERPRQGKIDQRKTERTERDAKNWSEVLQLHKHEEHVFVSRGPSSTFPAVLARCAEPADAHTWPSAGHAWRVLPQDFYALTESLNGSGRGSRHPAPPRMKKRRAEPPRDQPYRNSRYRRRGW